MGSDMLLRDLYLPAGTTLDLAAAKTTAGELCRHADVDDLRIPRRRLDQRRQPHRPGRLDR
jgi:hypothetical protein